MSEDNRIPLIVRRRYDPERLNAVTRSMSGKTRCPACDALNDAGQKNCDRCGAALYPEWDTDAPPQEGGLLDELLGPDRPEGSRRQPTPIDEGGGDVVSPPPAGPPVHDTIWCPKCRAPNPAENSYCGKCGSSLTRSTQIADGDQDSKETRARSADNEKDGDKPPYYT